MIAQNLPTVGRVEHLSNLVVLVHISIQSIQFVIGPTKQIVYQLLLPTIKSLPKYQFLPNQVSTSYAKKGANNIFLSNILIKLISCFKKPESKMKSKFDQSKIKYIQKAVEGLGTI